MISKIQEKDPASYLWKLIVEVVEQMAAKKQKERRISIGMIVIGKKPKNIPQNIYFIVVLKPPLKEKVKKTVYFVPMEPIIFADFFRPKPVVLTGHQKIPT